MSRRIARLLDEPEPVVTKLIQELEAKNGYPSHDARHLAENTQKIRHKVLDLGLDPDDTTPQELYHALQVRFERDSRQFDEFYGVKGAGFDQMSAAAVKLVNNNAELPKQWALKTKIAKQALKANQPKKLMKLLKYRSVDSMLKRENIYELYLAAQEVESKLWQKNLSKYLAALDQTDFETRQIQLVSLKESKWSEVGPYDYVTYDSRIGAVGLWPADDIQDAPLLAMVLLLIEAFTPQIHLKPGPELVKMNMVMWWVDTDHLVAELDGDHVSLNIKDCALNWWFKNSFEERTLDQGRKNFWQGLVNRYQNRPEVEPLFEDNIKEKIANLRLNIPEPAFEFAEEFNG